MVIRAAGLACVWILVSSLAWAETSLAASKPALKPYEAPNKSYALYKPADWKVQEQPGPDNLHIRVLAADSSAAVDFFWDRNQQGKANALLALAAFRQCLERLGVEGTWSAVYCSPDASHAMATLRYRSPQGPVQGTFYFEASPKALAVQGYHALETALARQRPLLLNIMASLAIAKPNGNRPEIAPAFQPQYVNPPLNHRRAQDGSLTLKTPDDWNFLAAGGKVITGSADGSLGFVFTAFSGNPILRGASVLQGVIAQPYITPPQALQVILSGFGHRDIKIQQAQADPSTNQECLRQIGQRCEAEDVVATWTSDKGADCLGFFKVINTAPSAMGLWNCILAGSWGPHKDFYRYCPLLEQVAASFAINDQYARRYIQDGLKRARELHDKTLAMMRENAKAREQQQADWEARQARKDFTESKWDDYRRGNSYWVSDLEGGKVYQADSHGVRDRVTNDYYEGKGYNWTNFEGTNPRHPSETMREVSSYELKQIMGR
jgi:hypothetical protein